MHSLLSQMSWHTGKSYLGPFLIKYAKKCSPFLCKILKKGKLVWDIKKKLLWHENTSGLLTRKSQMVRFSLRIKEGKGFKNILPYPGVLYYRTTMAVLCYCLKWFETIAGRLPALKWAVKFAHQKITIIKLNFHFSSMSRHVTLWLFKPLKWVF